MEIIGNIRKKNLSSSRISALLFDELGCNSSKLYTMGHTIYLDRIFEILRRGHLQRRINAILKSFYLDRRPALWRKLRLVDEMHCKYVQFLNVSHFPL